MMKKMLVGLLVAMVAVCFADYKTDFKFDLTDTTKIEKGLADSTSAKDNMYIVKYTLLKSLIGKNETNMTYADLKSTIYNVVDKIYGQNKVLWVRSYMISQITLLRFKKFIPSIAKDSTFYSQLNFIKNIVLNTNVAKTIGAKEWRSCFVNSIILNNKGFTQDVNLVAKFIGIYNNNVLSFTPEEVKADCALFKRLWFKNITVSDEWKQILVKIELMAKSVQ